MADDIVLEERRLGPEAHGTAMRDCHRWGEWVGTRQASMKRRRLTEGSNIKYLIVMTRSPSGVERRGSDVTIRLRKLRAQKGAIVKEGLGECSQGS